MPLVLDANALEERLANLPIIQYQPGESVLSGGSRTGKLFILKKGVVEVVKDGEQIAQIGTPGAVFGELAALLDQTHTADVRTVEHAELHVGDASELLANDAIVALYVAAVLAQRLDSANRALIEVKHQLQAGEPHSVINKTVERVGELLMSGGVNLVYAGYPYDPFASGRAPR